MSSPTKAIKDSHKFLLNMLFLKLVEVYEKNKPRFRLQPLENGILQGFLQLEVVEDPLILAYVCSVDST